MKLFYGAAMALILSLAATSTYAQSVDNTSNSTTSSNANNAANSASGANVGAQGITGVNAVVNSYGADHVSYDNVTKAQVPISVQGYGSFSQVSCLASVGGGATTRLFSFVYNGPTADTNCQHVVRGDAIGRAGQLALVSGDRDTAQAAVHTALLAYCTTDEDAKQDCINGGLIQAVGRKREHGKDVILVAPVITGATPLEVAKLNSQGGYTTVDYTHYQPIHAAPMPPAQAPISQQQTPRPSAPVQPIRGPDVAANSSVPSSVANQTWVHVSP